MQLAHKYGMDPAVWVVSTLLNRDDSQSSAVYKMLLVLAKSCPVCKTLELESSDPWPEEVDGV